MFVTTGLRPRKRAKLRVPKDQSIIKVQSKQSSSSKGELIVRSLLSAMCLGII